MPSSGGRAVAERSSDQMADELEALGLYATANDLRARRSTPARGVAHVTEYCLPNVERAVAKFERRDAEDPPVPGTWGASALPNCKARRDALQVFVDRWTEVPK